MIDVDFEAFIPRNNFENDARHTRGLFDLLNLRTGRLDKLAHCPHSSGRL